MKRLRVILLFLLLGAVVNVAVAWTIAVSVDINKAIRVNEPKLTFYETFNGESTFCIEYRRSRFGSLGIYSVQDLRDVESPIVPVNDELNDIVPVWAHEITLQGDIHHSIGRGWPMIALVSDRIMPTFGLIAFTGEVDLLTVDSTEILLPRWGWSNGYPRVLPLRPAWRGFTTNTLFYSAILWLLIPGPFVLRRLIRHKRGLCVKCAYDLRGVEHEVCPECGVEVMNARSV